MRKKQGRHRRSRFGQFNIQAGPRL